MNVLISVSNKSNLEKIAKFLDNLNCNIISTGGTYNHLKNIKVKIEVFRSMDLDFMQVKEWIISLYPNTLTIKDRTCESIADELFMEIQKKYPKRDVLIEVTDESDCGSSALYPKDPINIFNPNQKTIVIKCQI